MTPRQESVVQQIKTSCYFKEDARRGAFMNFFKKWDLYTKKYYADGDEAEEIHSEGSMEEFTGEEEFDREFMTIITGRKSISFINPLTLYGVLITASNDNKKPHVFELEYQPTAREKNITLGFAVDIEGKLTFTDKEKFEHFKKYKPDAAKFLTELTPKIMSAPKPMTPAALMRRNSA